jgi:hypothetical protein
MAVETINNVPNPVIGTTAISDISGTVVTVQFLIRYNGKGRFTCGVSWAGGSGNMDVYWSDDNNRWQAKEYKPERYRDEEGVRLGL